MAQATDRAVLPIGRENQLSEGSLVQPLTHEAGDVPASDVDLWRVRSGRYVDNLAIVHCRGERQRRWVVADDVQADNY
jgi:hypothetical protein